MSLDLIIAVLILILIGAALFKPWARPIKPGVENRWKPPPRDSWE